MRGWWWICWVKENYTFGVWWEGCLSPRGRGKVVFDLAMYLDVILLVKAKGIIYK